jgi:hypothetical protein
MHASTMDWGLGRVLHWDLEHIDCSRPIEAQIAHLKEDLAQIEYPNFVLIDIGWYPEFQVNGAFVVSVVRNKNWQLPLMRAKCATTKRLRALVRRAVTVATHK